jgi:hypothetical protein
MPATSTRTSSGAAMNKAIFLREAMMAPSYAQGSNVTPNFC